MTDNEIIKALENCLDYSPSCTICKYDADTLTSSECMGALMKDSLDLINRQKAIIEKSEKVEHFADKTIETATAEIERLEVENYTLKNKIEIRDNLIEQLGNDVNIKYNTIYTMREKLRNLKNNVIKEFAERLSKEFEICRKEYKNVMNDDGACAIIIAKSIVVRVVKEMTEVETNQRKEDEGK